LEVTVSRISNILFSARSGRNGEVRKSENEVLSEKSLLTGTIKAMMKLFNQLEAVASDTQ